MIFFLGPPPWGPPAPPTSSNMIWHLIAHVPHSRRRWPPPWPPPPPVVTEKEYLLCNSWPPFHRRTPHSIVELELVGRSSSFFFKPNQTKFYVHLFHTYLKYMLEYGMSYLPVGWATAMDKHPNVQASRIAYYCPRPVRTGLGENPENYCVFFPSYSSIPILFLHSCNKFYLILKYIPSLLL